MPVRVDRRKLRCNETGRNPVSSVRIRIDPLLFVVVIVVDSETRRGSGERIGSESYQTLRVPLLIRYVSGHGSVVWQLASWCNSSMINFYWSIAMGFLRRVRRSLRGCRPKISFGLSLFEDGYCVDVIGYLIALPFLDRWLYEPKEIMDRWGFYVMDRRLWLCWGNKYFSIRFPWDFEHLKHEVMRPDGAWVKASHSWEKDYVPDGRWEARYPYRYVLKSGEVQERMAKIHVERREWRWYWFMWSPWPALKRQSIDIEFDGEVGERSGSWKGGCIGCGYDMKPGETAEQCLSRMERERIFD